MVYMLVLLDLFEVGVLHVVVVGFAAVLLLTCTGVACEALACVRLCAACVLVHLCAGCLHYAVEAVDGVVDCCGHPSAG